jgi:hypothetical protein
MGGRFAEWSGVIFITFGLECLPGRRISAADRRGWTPIQKAPKLADWHTRAVEKRDKRTRRVNGINKIEVPSGADWVRFAAEPVPGLGLNGKLSCSRGRLVGGRLRPTRA